MEVDGDVGVIHVQGDVDSMHSASLQEAAENLLGDGARSLVFDCGEIAFIDSTGLSVLLESRKRAELQFGTVTVRNPNAFLVRLLEITGLQTVLVIDTSREHGERKVGPAGIEPATEGL